MNKFLSQYNSLTKEKRKDFISFLYYVKILKREDCIKLCKHLNYLINKGMGLDKESLYEFIYSDKAYNDKALRYLFSYLSKAIEKYIILLVNSNDKLNEDLSLLQFYLDKGLASLFEQKAAMIEEELNISEQRSIKYYESAGKLYEMWYRFRSQQGRRGDMKIEDWKKTFYNYASCKMALQGSLHLSYKVYNQEAQEAMDDRAMNALLTMEDAPVAAKIYHMVYKLLSDNKVDESEYQEIKTSIRNSYTIFDTNESKPVVLLIINYCIRMINQGKDEFQTECLEWYEWGLSKSILTDGQNLSRFTYKNMISLAIKFNRFKKAFYILETYKKDLLSEEVESVYNFNMARLYFYKKEYKTAMRILQMMIPSSMMDNLDAKRMLLRMYFEEGDFDLLDNHLVNFKAFLLRHKEIGYHRTHYLNLIKYTSRLIRVKNIERRNLLLDQIRKDSNITDKEWLIKAAQ